MQTLGVTLRGDKYAVAGCIGLAEALEAERTDLVAIADAETALGPVRLNGELDRTAFQLRRFADLAEAGVPFAHVDDPAVAGPPPGGHPAMVRTLVPLGPVAMFSASNFPFAFSVLGDDTASALAAGCPVLVKAHSAHLLLSARVHALAQRVLNNLGLPSGLIGMVQGAGGEVGMRLIHHPAIAAGAFTGSTRGGAALQAQASARPRPIPFYGELGSINPVVALPGILATRGAELAQTLAASIGAGTGQFCTSPGLIFLIDDPASTAFVDELANGLKKLALHPRGVLERWTAHDRVAGGGAGAAGRVTRGQWKRGGKLASFRDSAIFFSSLKPSCGLYP
ncbi:aldehyde dehydrogenase family protein [Janthinobacterium sp. PSPC3-1]|uniref:aldehyde dehydrogenase family protein n=1 Tax=Janthinobacterium sp. PSPC3-1 TaxID=2804653 RepID=UPI003CF638C5